MTKLIPLLQHQMRFLVQDDLIKKLFQSGIFFRRINGLLKLKYMRKSKNITILFLEKAFKLTLIIRQPHIN